MKDVARSTGCRKAGEHALGTPVKISICRSAPARMPNHSPFFPECRGNASFFIEEAGRSHENNPLVVFKCAFTPGKSFRFWDNLLERWLTGYRSESYWNSEKPGNGDRNRAKGTNAWFDTNQKAQSAHHAHRPAYTVWHTVIRDLFQTRKYRGYS